MEKVKNFLLNKWKLLLIIVFTFVLVVILSVLLIPKDNEEIQSPNEVKYIDTLRKKDKGIFNKVQTDVIKGRFKGIDVSSWQGDIDFEKLSQSEIDFVMIRCGFRSTESGEIKEDNKFQYNIKEANKYGIPVGIYFYSAATSLEEALDEASYVINLIKDYEVLYPIVYDFEIFHLDRVAQMTVIEVNDNALAFMDYVEEHGYHSMLYTNLYNLQTYWNYDRFENRNIWFAKYMEDEDHSNDYHMWQYSDRGRVDGIIGNVDLDEAYYMYVKK